MPVFEMIYRNYCYEKFFFSMKLNQDKSLKTPLLIFLSSIDSFSCMKLGVYQIKFLIAYIQNKFAI